MVPKSEKREIAVIQVIKDTNRYRKTEFVLITETSKSDKKRKVSLQKNKNLL